MRSYWQFFNVKLHDYVITNVRYSAFVKDIPQNALAATQTYDPMTMRPTLYCIKPMTFVVAIQSANHLHIAQHSAERHAEK